MNGSHRRQRRCLRHHRQAPAGSVAYEAEVTSNGDGRAGRSVLNPEGYDSGCTNEVQSTFPRQQAVGSPRADLTRANLLRVNLRKADLRGANLSSANLNEATATGSSTLSTIPRSTIL
jgi:Pentapeptide repeats (8 copies)